MAIRRRRFTTSEIVLFVAFVVALCGLGFVAYKESQVTPAFTIVQRQVSLSAEGIGVFIWRVRGGLLAGIEDRETEFSLNPPTAAQLVSLNGQGVGSTTGRAATDRAGRIVAVVRVVSQGPIALTGTDLRSSKSVAAAFWGAP